MGSTTRGSPAQSCRSAVGPVRRTTLGYSVTGSCATGGLDDPLRHQPGLQLLGNVARLRLPRRRPTRRSHGSRSGAKRYGQGTTSGGNWRMRAIVGADVPLGGSFGPDQCKTGEPYHPTTCRIGGAAYGDAAASRYDVAASTLRLGLECFAPQLRELRHRRRRHSARFLPAQGRGRHDPRRGTARARRRRAAVRVRLAPRVTRTSSYSATDNTGIKNVRLLLDGQERAAIRPHLRLHVPAALLGHGEPPDRPRQRADHRRAAAGATRRGGRRGQPDLGHAHGLDRRARAEATLTRASGRTITVRVWTVRRASRAGRIEVRNRRSEPFRALPTTLAERSAHRASRPWQRRARRHPRKCE